MDMYLLLLKKLIFYYLFNIVRFFYYNQKFLPNAATVTSISPRTCRKPAPSANGLWEKPSKVPSDKEPSAKGAYNVRNKRLTGM